MTLKKKNYKQNASGNISNNDYLRCWTHSPPHRRVRTLSLSLTHTSKSGETTYLNHWKRFSIIHLSRNHCYSAANPSKPLRVRWESSFLHVRQSSTSVRNKTAHLHTSDHELQPNSSCPSLSHSLRGDLKRQSKTRRESVAVSSISPTPIPHLLSLGLDGFVYTTFSCRLGQFPGPVLFWANRFNNTAGPCVANASWQPFRVRPGDTCRMRPQNAPRRRRNRKWAVIGRVTAWRSCDYPLIRPSPHKQDDEDLSDNSESRAAEDNSSLVCARTRLAFGVI